MTIFRSLEIGIWGVFGVASAIAGSACFSACSSSSPAAASVDAGTDATNIISPSYSYEDSGIIVGAGGTGTDTVDEDASAPAAVVINEVDYDESGTDTAEFVELFNPSTTASIDVSNMALTFVNSSSEYLRVNLSGSIAPGGYLVVADAAVVVPVGPTVIRFTKATDNIRNGPDAIAIIDRTSADILDALSYGGAISGYVEGTATDAIDTASGTGSLIRNPNGTDTNNAVNDWVFTTSITPGAANTKTP
ncbi:MAG: lamin tail domain-containing protein [Polyangiaceae bacterium]